MIINFLIFLFNLKKFLISSSCILGINHCLKCNPLTNLCVKCDKNIYIPDKSGGCEKSNQCLLGYNQCIECNEEGNLCKTCIGGYFPDQNGGCSYTSNCEISYQGNCLKCKNDYILIGEDNDFNNGIKICKSLIEGDLKNCAKINIEKGFCEECKEDYYLGSGDKKCTKTKNCSESVFEICTKCEYGYYLYKKENLCKKQFGLLENCKISLNDITCDTCEEDYYFDENKKCIGVNFCKREIKYFRCQECIEGFFLTEYGAACTPEINCEKGDKDFGICILCKNNYYLDLKDGKCKSNQENNKFKFCQKSNIYGECIQCLDGYILSQDNKCSKTENCAEVFDGICSYCLDNYYLGLDQRCSKIQYCIYSNDITCLECQDNYYFDGSLGICKLGEGNLKNCKSGYEEWGCEYCKDNYYQNQTNRLCYSNNNTLSDFYKCSKTDMYGNFCIKCINGYHLGQKDNKCSSIDGCILSENSNICLECDNYYCLDVKLGKCIYNNDISDERNNFYYKCKKTNKEGNKCEECIEGSILDNNGLCIDKII